MEICGSVHGNLRAALQSARRLRGGPIHPDTLDHWARLVALAKGEAPAMDSFKTRELVSDLEQEIKLRTAAT